jgi:hypothetical protein
MKFLRFGPVQLDNLKAEELLGNLWRDIEQLIIKKFGYADVSKLVCKVTSNYHIMNFMTRHLVKIEKYTIYS